MSVKDRLEKLEGKYGIPMKRELKEEVGKMCTYSYAIAERAREDGRQDGIKQGTNRLNHLILRLMSEKRFEDLKRAAEDGEYQEKLYKEFNIE